MVGEIHLAKIYFTNLSEYKIRPVLVPKNFTLHKSILFKYLGKLKDIKQKEIFQVFCKEIGCH